MNCQACRNQVQPFLDDELSVKDNVQVLEHITACAACADVFGAEKRIWESVRARLQTEVCPRDVAARALGRVRAAHAWWRRPAAAGWLGGVAAAALAIVWLATRDTPPVGPHVPDRAAQRVTFAAHREHVHGAHGELLAWAGARYDELVDSLSEREILTGDRLAAITVPSRSVGSMEDVQASVEEILHTRIRLPDGFLEGGRIAGAEMLPWHDGWIPQVIIEYGDREIAVYELSRCHSVKFGGCITKLFTSLTQVEACPSRRVRIDACRGCDAVVVLRDERAYILISRQGRDWADDDWMIKRARKLID